MSTYADYYKQIFKLGLPIFVGQVGMIVVGFADNIMVGRYSTEALASASFVNQVFNVVVFCCIGFTYGVLPLAGALFGKDEKERVGELVRVALWQNIIYSLLLTALMTIVYFNVERMGQPSELMPLIKPYYRQFLAGVLSISLFNVFAQWSYSIKNTTVPMWIILCSNAVNIAGNYMLIYGHFGLPELGLYGAGLSTLVARWLCPVAIMLWFFFAKSNAPYRKGFFSSGARDGARRVWAASLPISMQLTFESGSFSVAGVMAGWIGAIQLAAFQIFIIVGTLGFTLYYAIGSAAAVLVSNETGKGDAAAMRRAGWASYHVILLLAALSSIVFVVLGRDLMHWFTEDEAVLSAAVALIFPLVLYQLGDATQINFTNCLRGTGKVKPMLWIAFVSYILVGIPATYLLAFTAGMGLYGIILSFSVSLFLAGALFLAYFLKASRTR